MSELHTIALGTQIQDGPFGGGNQFARALKNSLERAGMKVVSDLTASDIDVILVTSVKPWARGAAFDIVAALRYAKTHPRTKVVLRVNECDERKGDRLPLLNSLLRASADVVDHTIFVSQWLQEMLCAATPLLKTASSVIHSGADPAIFNPTGQETWNGREPLKIVTHHWSSSWYKGWDVYQALDDYLGTPAGKQYSFTFIGNPWPKTQLRHTQAIPPQNGQELAHILKQHHVYISASQNEPAGMHYIEALQCGLPIIWRPSGSLSEYCQSRGVSFTNVEDLPKALRHMRRDYQHLSASRDQPSYTAQDMCRAYLDLFETLQQADLPASHSIGSLRLRQGALWLRDSLV